MVNCYYPVVEALVKKICGSEKVFAFDHNIRRAGYKEMKNSRINVQKPLSNVHTDYTVTSGPKRLRDLTNLPKKNDTRNEEHLCGKPLIDPKLVFEECSKSSKSPSTGSCSSPSFRGFLNASHTGENKPIKRRFGIINVWRSVSGGGPVQQYPLGVVHPKSVDWKSDLSIFEIHYADRQIEFGG